MAEIEISGYNELDPVDDDDLVEVSQHTGSGPDTWASRKAQVQNIRRNKTVDFNFISNLGPFFNTALTSYQTVGQFIFRGTTEMGTPTNIKAIAWRASGAGSGSIRIYDSTNALVICEATGITDAAETIRDLGALSNLPASEAIWEYQIKVSAGGTKARTSALEIQW